jgi:hypothetical protein
LDNGDHNIRQIPPDASITAVFLGFTPASENQNSTSSALGGTFRTSLRRVSNAKSGRFAGMAEASASAEVRGIGRVMPKLSLAVDHPDQQAFRKTAQ